MCNLSLFLQQDSGNMVDTEFLLLVQSPICKGPLMCGEWLTPVDLKQTVNRKGWSLEFTLAISA
jgi:hypothetical protein